MIRRTGWVNLAMVVLLCAAGPKSVCGQAQEPQRPPPLRPRPAEAVVTGDSLRAPPPTGVRTSPGWVRFTGGFVTGTAALAGLVAATWDDPDAVSGPLVYAAYALGTWSGAAITTSFWERPNVGLLAGAALGALPMLIAVSADDDDTASSAFLVAWITAPLGAAVGQSTARGLRR
jgi:hypothetical protein